MKIDRVGGAARLHWIVLAVGSLAAILVLGGALGPEALAAQVNPAAASPQMRHFWHVFAAYAAAWILLFGWVFSIFRRLGRVEEKLDA